VTNGLLGAHTPKKTYITNKENHIMKLARLVSLVLGAVLAIGLVGVSSASAVPPLFSAGSVGATFIAESLPGTLKAGGEIVWCAKDQSEGAIANVHLVGPLFVHFLECKSSSNGSTFCTANSQGQSGGLILTKTLHALLGLALPSNLPALLFLPTSGKQFLLLTKNECTEESLVTGNVAALVSNQRGVPSSTTLLTFRPKDIELIHTLNGLVTPALTAFSEPATLETVVHVRWSREVEIV
jgi:hypothetical protein